jgi:hypothetical protein
MQEDVLLGVHTGTMVLRGIITASMITSWAHIHGSSCEILQDWIQHPLFWSTFVSILC